MKFQINRVDAFAQDSTTTSFPRADSDYGSGCGYVDINLVDAGDDVFAGSDFRMELSAMHTIFPIAIRAAEILKLDADLQPLWRKFEEELAPVPARAGRPRLGFGGFVAGTSPAAAATRPDEQLKARFMEFTLLGGFTDPRGIGGPQVFRNRLRLREGPGALDCEHLGGLALGVHSALLSSEPPTPGGEPIIQVFSAWPHDWDARYTLLAKGNFLVSASQQMGKIEFVEVLSQGGQACTLKNPWGNATVDLYRNGTKSENLSNSLLTFKTVKGEDLLVLPDGATADQFKRAVP